MYRLGITSPTECWTGTVEYFETPSVPALAPSPSPPPPTTVSTAPQTTDNIGIGTPVVKKEGSVPETVGQVERVEGTTCWVRWTKEGQAEECAISSLTVRTPSSGSDTNVPAAATSLQAQTSEGASGPITSTTTATTQATTAAKVLDRKKLTLEPAKFGQRVILGVVLWLDFMRGGKVRGSLEFCEFRARITIEGEWRPKENLLIIIEKELIAGRNSEWNCRFGQDAYVPGTTYELQIDPSREDMTCEFQLPASLTNLSDPEVRPLGTMKVQRRRLFSLSADAHGSSMIVPKDDRTSVRLSPLGGESSLAGLALAEVGFSRGVHYWELKMNNAEDHGTIFCGVVERPAGPIYPAGIPVPNLNRWEKVPVSWGFVSFRATLWMMANSSTGGTEQIYGEFFESGDTVGVLLDLDAGEISFFIDALRFGEHIMRDLGPAFLTHQLGSRIPIKWNPSSELQVLYPAIGLKRCAGDAASVTSKYISFPSSEPQDELENVSRLGVLLRGHFRDGETETDSEAPTPLTTAAPVSVRPKLPSWFVAQAYAHYLRWSKNRYRHILSRAGGRPVEVDISPEAMVAASAVGGVDPPFYVGERVKTLQSQGRELSAAEDAIVLGTRMNRIWYSITTVSTHEGFAEGATWAFYWEPEELPLLMREDAPTVDRAIMNAGVILTREEFEHSACGEDWTCEMDHELVRLVNFVLQREGEQDAMNLDFARAYSVTAFSNRLMKSEPECKARVAVLRLFNCMVKRALPFFTSSSAKLTDASGNSHRGFASRCHRSRRFVFTTTKRSFWEAVLKSTTTGTTLSSEEYVDPPQIRTVMINRIKATPAKLATVTSESKRMKRSVFGQLYAEMMKWPDHSFRRAYCGKGHGGQKRAFKLKLIGEGVDDYGGPYRQAFEVVCDELQNDSEWPDARRACLLPLFIPCPNRFSAVGDIGRDKFVLNPSARSPSLLRRFEFLGKLMGTAVRHGMQLGLDLPQFFWRKLVSMPVTKKHLEEMDVSFVRDLRNLENATPQNFAETIGTDRKFQVVLSDGTIIGGEDAAPVTVENVHEYVQWALRVRLHEADAQMDALKRGLSAVLPLEHLQLFTPEELETMVCGRRELDVELLKSIAEYATGVQPTDAHVKWFWEVLEEMTAEDRTAFLKFVWARSRMPSKAEMLTAFHIQQPSGGAAERPDDFLPSAQTCFFSLALPRYSSKELLRTKFLKAIECTLMDADVRLRSAEGWAEV